uniref:Lipocalin n=1 Tax=Rhipicephalus appendiculatus TaxID=34631 RepID=A0A131YRU5_RHIAP
MNKTPPYEMDVYRFKYPEHGPHNLWELKYNETGTYNCSVFKIYNKTTVSSKDSKCALYVRGVPKQIVKPTVNCQIAFNNCSQSWIVSKPYINKCSMLVPDQ